MKTTNKKMTFKEAEKMSKCKFGMEFPKTEHNLEMMKKVTDRILDKLREKRI
jgi:hypothetical protein